MTAEPNSLLDSPAILPSAAISAVNLAEVVTKLGRHLPQPNPLLQVHKLLSVPVLAWDENAAMGSLRFAHLADDGLSLGDRACITEAMRRALSKMVTADRSWKKIGLIKARVELIR